MSGLHEEDWIRPDGRGGIRIGDAHVKRADLAAVVELMYRVAGAPPQLLLPRFKVSATGEATKFWMVKAEQAGVRVRCTDVLPPDEARTLACVIAAYADEQEER